MCSGSSKTDDTPGAPGGGKRRVRVVFEWLYALGRCVTAGVLSALLIAGLIVGAPWRINAVIGALLTNLVVVPRRLRVCFDVVFGAVFLAVVVWVFSPDNDADAWRPYTFAEELRRAEAERMIPAEENAANTYKAIFAGCDSETFDSDLYHFDPYCRTLSNTWSLEEYPKVAQWLDDNAAVIDTLLDAAALQQCRFSLPVTQLARDRQMLRLNVMQRWMEVLLRSINKDMGEGRNDTAIEKISALGRVAGHLYQQQTILDLPAGLTIELMAFGATNRLIMQCDPTERQLGDLEKPLQSVGNTFDEEWGKVFDNEKLFIKNIAGLFYEINSQGKIRCSHNSIPSINAQFKMGLHPIRYIRHAPRMTALFLWFVLPHRPERMGRTIDRIFDRHFGLICSGGQSVREGSLPLGKLQLNYKSIIELAAVRSSGYYYPLSSQSVRRISCRNATRLLTALKRYHTLHGRWPGTLDELKVSAEILIDPINNGSFAYRRIGEYFVFYSKGANGKDDDGRHNSWEKTDDLPIWPERSYVTGEDL